jgi:hypothetical protein
LSLSLLELFSFDFCEAFNPVDFIFDLSRAFDSVELVLVVLSAEVSSANFFTKYFCPFRMLHMIAVFIEIKKLNGMIEFMVKFNHARKMLYFEGLPYPTQTW